MKAEIARGLVSKAVAKGALVRPSICARCNTAPPPTSDGRSGIQGHHHDYSKPLDVEWLCARCHRAETPLPKVMGRPNHGEDNGFSRLTDAAVIAAKRLRQKGLSFQRIADQIGVSKATVLRAVNGKSWKHIAAAPTPAQEPVCNHHWSDPTKTTSKLAFCFKCGALKPEVKQ